MGRRGRFDFALSGCAASRHDFLLILKSAASMPSCNVDAALSQIQSGSAARIAGRYPVTLERREIAANR